MKRRVNYYFWMLLCVGLLGAGCSSPKSGGVADRPSYSSTGKRFTRDMSQEDKRNLWTEQALKGNAKASETSTAYSREVPSLIASVTKAAPPRPTPTPVPEKNVVAKPKEKEAKKAPKIVAPKPEAAVSKEVYRVSKVYNLRPSDQVLISLSGIPEEVELQDVIDEEGFVTLPYIDRVQAAGLTSSELERKIRKAYQDGKIYRNITVNVVVPTQSFYIRGEVKTPGRFPLIAGMTVLQAVASAGGYTEYANSRRIKILRKGEYFFVNGKEIEVDPEKDRELEASDVVIVPRSVF